MPNNVSQTSKQNNTRIQDSKLQNQNPVSGIEYHVYPNDMNLGQRGNSIMFSIFAPDASLAGEGFSEFGTDTNIERTRRVQESQISLSRGREVLNQLPLINSTSQKTKDTVARSSVDSSQYSLLTQGIQLYMPNNLTFGSTINWQEKDFGIVGDILSSDLQLDALDQGIEGGKKLRDRAEKLFFQETQEVVNRKILNPYREILFKGLQNRTFQFQFKFLPRSQREAATVKKIIQLFRFHAHPSIDTTEKNTFVYPSEFEIDFRHHASDNVYIPRISTCACTSVEVSYGETLFATNPDGNPVETTLTLSFTELEVLTKERIVQNY